MVTKIFVLLLLIFSQFAHANNLNRIQDLRKRAAQIVSVQTAKEIYWRYKALQWLDTAFRQQSENDRTGYVTESLQQAENIILSFEGVKDFIDYDPTPTIAKSLRLRTDLWDQIEILKNNTTLICTAEHLAKAEINLVRAEHQDHQTGWRGARVFIEMSEYHLKKAQELDNRQCI